MVENTFGTGLKCGFTSRMDSILGSPVYRYVEAMNFRETSRNLFATADFLREQETSSIGKFFGRGKGNESPEFNKVEISIFRRELGKDISVASGVGNWTRFVAYGNQLYWQWRNPVPKVIYEPSGQPLPSSSLMRKEIAKIAEKRYPEADK